MKLTCLNSEAHHAVLRLLILKIGHFQFKMSEQNEQKKPEMNERALRKNVSSLAFAFQVL